MNFLVYRDDLTLGGAPVEDGEIVADSKREALEKLKEERNWDFEMVEMSVGLVLNAGQGLIWVSEE